MAGVVAGAPEGILAAGEVLGVEASGLLGYATLSGIVAGGITGAIAGGLATNWSPTGILTGAVMGATLGGLPGAAAFAREMELSPAVVGLIIGDGCAWTEALVGSMRAYNPVNANPVLN